MPPIPEGSEHGQGDICDTGRLRLYYPSQSILWTAGDAHLDDDTGNIQDLRGLGFEPTCGYSIKMVNGIGYE